MKSQFFNILTILHFVNVVAAQWLSIGQILQDGGKVYKGDRTQDYLRITQKGA